MSDMIRVKPAVAGTLVRNPERAFRPLKAEGELVPNRGYWLRRLAQGCVVEVVPEEDRTDETTTPDAKTPAPGGKAAEVKPAPSGGGSAEPSREPSAP